MGSLSLWRQWALLYRFHLVPCLVEFKEAVLRKPWFFMVALLIFWGLTTQTGPWSSGPWEAVVPVLGVLVLSFSLGRKRRDRNGFYSFRPTGARVQFWYGFFYLMAVWGSLSGAVLWVFGVPELVPSLVWVLSGPPVCGLFTVLSGRALQFKFVLGRPKKSAWASLGGPVAFLWNQPGRFLGPLAATLAILGWAWAGSGGFVWADHPPAAGLILDFLWPTLFGLGWAGTGSVLPWRFFSVARAPVRRILAVLALPVVLETGLVLILISLTAGPWPEMARSWVLNLAGIFFWFFFGLRVGRVGLPSLVVSGTVLVFGVVADRDWWIGWAAVLFTGAAGLAWSFWERYPEMGRGPGEDGNA